MSKKNDEDSALSSSIDKVVVLQEARAFNESPLNPKQCRLILTKLIYVLHQNGVYTTEEATQVFFSITKLFQCPDLSLRQMVYLAIKELSSIAQDVIMVTSSLTKDINARGDSITRPNAIRALCKVTDASMIPGIERFVKQSIVDKNPDVSSAAIVSASHLFHLNKDIVKRWSNEVQEALTSKSPSTQYHALGLLYQIRQHDRMAVIKLIQNLARGSLRSPQAICMLIRYSAKIMDEDDVGGRSLYDVLESFLRHKSDMVVYEAARAICGLRAVTAKELFGAVSALQLMLVNHKPLLRFAAIRTLNRVAMQYPTAVFPCNLDMENLITDSNRSIATFAITTLLKTGTEASVDRLMKQITGFMNEISDEFKVIVVDAVRSLCLKFPSKQNLMIGFLSGVLRDEGGYDFKKSIVEAMFDIIHQIPSSKEYALSHLCEYIEDCEFSKLAVRILHLLGAEGPKAASPTKYIRYIYNRVILENAPVRAAAVSALAQFALHLEEARPRIRVLLDRCTDDSDDEVRDRAATYLLLLENEDLFRKYISNESSFAWAALESNLERYVKNPSAHIQPFDFSTIPVISRDQEHAERLAAKERARDAFATPDLVKSSAPLAGGAVAGAGIAADASTSALGSSFDAQTAYLKAMEKIPQLASLGQLYKSSKPFALTEAETEYVVNVIKHVFPKHLVFQFECKNTLNDSILENVTMAMNMSADDPEAGGLQPDFMVPAEKLVYNAPSSIYVVYKRVNGVCPNAYFSNTLKFIVKDCDPDTGEADEEGFEDEYVVEDFEVVVGDYIIPSYITGFEKAWSDLSPDAEVVETYSLTAVTSIKAATSTLLDLLGVQPVDGTGNVDSKATTHQLLAAGMFTGGVPVLVRARMAFDSTSGVTMELSVRSKSPAVSEKVANAIS